MVDRLPDLLGIFITDKDGVVVCERRFLVDFVVRLTMKELQPDLPARVIDPPLSATFAVAIDQVSNLFCLCSCQTPVCLREWGLTAIRLDK